MNLPADIDVNHSVINVANIDNKCFMWSVLAQLHPAPFSLERVSHYEAYKHELNMDGIPYPVALRDIDRVEAQNPGMSVSIIGLEVEERDEQPSTSHVFPLRISKVKPIDDLHDVSLLYISDEFNSHYALITQPYGLSSLIYRQWSRYEGRTYV